MSDEGKHSRTVANAGPPTGLAYIYSPQSRHARCCLRGLVPVCARLPVLVLAMGTALAHMLRADAGTTADAPDHGTEGPAGPRFLAWSAGPGRGGPGPDRTAGASSRVRSFRTDQAGPAASPRRQGGNSKRVRHQPGTGGRQQAYSSGKAGVQTGLRSKGIRGSNHALNALARTINAELTGIAVVPARPGNAVART